MGGHKLESTEVEMLGKCEKIVIDKDNTTIINGGGNKKNISTRINQIKAQKNQVDDALAATKAAIEEGIIPGGGVALIRAAKALENLKGDNEDETTGIRIVHRAIEEPLR